MPSLAHKLARPEILAIEPYKTAFDEAARSREIKLDANESPYSALASYPEAEQANRYPEPQPKKLVARLADLYGVSRDQVFVGRGADEAIDLLVRAFCRPVVDSVAICPPTFGYYETAASIQGARIVSVPLGAGFDLDAERLVNRCTEEASVKIVFLCSPMNPTGNSLPRDVVLRICGALADCLVVVDEAYVEFSEHESFADLIGDIDNLVVLRTLSKAYGLAGARCGCALADGQIIEVIKRIMPPYPVPSITEQVVTEVLSPSRRQLIGRRIEESKVQRRILQRKLRDAPDIVRVFPSDANFLLVQVEDPEGFQLKLGRFGVCVRRRDREIENAFRITVGSPQENEILLQALGVEGDLPAQRTAEVIRATSETSVTCWVNLDRSDQSSVDTGIGFFDHMLEQVARHGGFSLRLVCNGDLHVDTHHTVEDCALTLGETLKKALGDKRGIGRFGFVLPMDEAEAKISIDISGRPFLSCEADFAVSHIGAYPTEMTEHVFRSLADSMSASIHLSVSGENDHHKTEACFKAFGRALRMAVRQQGTDMPSTKGVL